MRSSVVVVAPALLVLSSGRPPVVALAAAQESAPSQRRIAARLNPVDVADAQKLVEMADAAMRSSESLASDIAVSWNPHFLPAPDGRTYVPFTLVFEDVTDDSFGAVALYVRAVRKGQTESVRETSGRAATLDVDPTGLPIFGYDSASAHAAALRLLANKHARDRYPFEDFGFVQPEVHQASGRRVVRRALVLPAGAYAIYVTAKARTAGAGAASRTAQLKSETDVPDFSGSDLSLSSLVLVERGYRLTRPLSGDERAGRPYALGSVELVPPLENRLPRAGSLRLMFIVRGPAFDSSGKPDLTVEYAFQPLEGADGAPPMTVPSDRLDRQNLPADFDVRAGHELSPSRSFPLSTFHPGRYRLEVRVTDHFASRSRVGRLEFTVY